VECVCDAFSHPPRSNRSPCGWTPRHGPTNRKDNTMNGQSEPVLSVANDCLTGGGQMGELMRSIEVVEDAHRCSGVLVAGPPDDGEASSRQTGFLCCSCGVPATASSITIRIGRCSGTSIPRRWVSRRANASLRSGVSSDRLLIRLSVAAPPPGWTTSSSSTSATTALALRRPTSPLRTVLSPMNPCRAGSAACSQRCTTLPSRSSGSARCQRYGTSALGLRKQKRPRKPAPSWQGHWPSIRKTYRLPALFTRR
jgi:hypothetical protein